MDWAEYPHRKQRNSLKYGLRVKFPIWAFACLFLTKMACSPKISRARATQLPPQLIRSLSPELTDGVSASRIEEMVVLTPDGVKIISLYPAKEPPVANRY